MQGAAISQLSSVQCAVSFKVIPLTFLPSSALFLTEIFFYRPLSISKFTGFLVCLSELAVHCFEFISERRDTLFQLFHGGNMS